KDEGAPEECVIYRRGPMRIRCVGLFDEKGRATTGFKQGGAMKVRGWYACEGPLPPETLGLAMAGNQRSDLMCVNQFNTHCYRTADEVQHYGNAPFRLRPGTEGVFEATIDPIQLRHGEYLLSVGLLPNIPDNWGFYEYHHHAYMFTVLA